MKIIHVSVSDSRGGAAKAAYRIHKGLLQIGAKSKMLVLIKESDELYYQYMDKRSVIYAGLFKDFSLTDRQFKGNLSFTVSLYAAYTFGNKFKGTNLAPENKLKLIPAVSLNWTKNSINVFCGTEYMKTEYFRVGPMWARIGFSYSLLFNRERSPGKTIRWY